MTDEQFNDFVSRLKNDPQLLSKFEVLESEEEIIALASEIGYQLPSKDLVSKLENAYSELSVTELEQVSGGAAAESKWGTSSNCTSQCALTCYGTKYCPPGTPLPDKK